MKQVLRRLLGRPTAATSLLVLLMVLGAAVLAPWVAPANPQRMDILHRLAPPSAAHLLGTDDFGRDVLSRVIYGARLSVTSGTLVVVFSIVAGTALGLVAGSVRRLDELLMRFTDALMAFPDILLAIALMAALGPSLLDVVLALGVVYTPRVARLVRGAVLVLRRLTFIEAAEALGADDWRVIRVHILPNLVSPLLVQSTFIFAAAVLTEAALSFLGAGIPPTTPSWGNMIAGAQQYVDRAAWLIFAPGGAILLTVLALQILGDALRDALDPKLRRLT
jgi:peptide/nickel transport system permease protein